VEYISRTCGPVGWSQDEPTTDRSQVDCDKPRDPLSLPLQVRLVQPTAPHLNLSESPSQTDVMASMLSDTTIGTGEQSVTSTRPIPMSFPAILRASKLADRFAHLRLASGPDEPTSDAVVKQNRREDREGKRWIRRKENCRFRWLNEIAWGVH